LAGHHRPVGVPIRHLVGQDMPDDDQQLAGNGDTGDNGFALAQGGNEALERRLAEGMVRDGAPGGFD
jgi:hypothetical protein